MRLPFSEHAHPPRGLQSQEATPPPGPASNTGRAPDPFGPPVDPSAPLEDDPDRTPRAKELSRKVLAEYDQVEVDSGEDELPIPADDEDEAPEPAPTKGRGKRTANASTTVKKPVVRRPAKPRKQPKSAETIDSEDNASVQSTATTPREYALAQSMDVADPRITRSNRSCRQEG